jgi:hypothetical protein
MIKRYSLHKIESDIELSFSPEAYSKFKFGDDTIAESFGRSLAEGFIQYNKSMLLENNPILVVSSPYSFIPTATFAMKNHFMNELNSWLYKNNLSVSKEVKVSRTITYKEDYGTLDAEERLRLIGKDQFYIDKNYVKGHTLLFLDDIRITGSHEKMILKMADEFSLDNKIHLLYFAELSNENIHPNFENYLNYYFVKSLNDLHSIINVDRFLINTRIVKFILNNSKSDFVNFIELTSLEFKKQLYFMSIGNSYHEIDVYKSNINLLAGLVK